MEQVTGLLNRAWDAIIAGNPKKARDLLNGEAWTKFDQAEQNNLVRRHAQNLQQSLLQLSHDDAQYWLSKPLNVEKTIEVLEDGADVEKNITVKDLITKRLNSDELARHDSNATINGAFIELQEVLHEVNNTRTAQAAALTQYEATRFSELTENKGFLSRIAGVVRYNGELIRDRWKGSHADGTSVTFDASGGLFSNIKSTPNLDSKAVQEAAKQAQDQVEQVNGKLGINEALGENIGNFVNKAKENNSPSNDNIRSVTLDGKSLGEFSKVSKLDTKLKKATAAGITLLGGGLLVHGAHNAMCAFNPQKDQHLEVEELGQTTSSEGINWTRLAVGAGEAALGAAVMYRGLSGRWGLGAVEGYAERF